MARYIDDITNQKFGKLTAITFSKIKNKHAHWFFQCACKNKTIKELSADKVILGTTISCGCENHKKGNLAHNWLGYKDITGEFFNHIKNGAKKRCIKFNITIRELWNLYIKQNRKCALSGIDLYFSPTGRNNRSKGNISLDRINSKKGYIKNNIQWVHKDINWMKQDYSQEEYINICKLVAENNKNV